MVVFFKRWMMDGKAVSMAMICALLLSGCGLFSGKEEDKTANWSASKLYAEAQDEMQQGGWGNAIKYLEQLQSRYPFGRYAQQAQMELAYAHWKDGDNDLAVSSAERFIKQYPNNPNVDYVYYLRGLINFNDDLGLLSSIARQDLTERDPKALRDAFDAFRELVVRFPDSKYTPDATVRLKYLVNAMASHEVHVASYYLRRGAYVAAVDRAQGVIRNYQQAPAVEDALQIMVDSYDRMGLTQLRDDAARVLNSNFPDHEAKKNRPKASWWKFWKSAE